MPNDDNKKKNVTVYHPPELLSLGDAAKHEQG